MADLRSTSVDFKRDHTNKAKWAKGEAYGPGRSKEGHAAPARSKYKFPRTNHELRLDRNTKTASRLDILTETHQPRSQTQTQTITTPAHANYSSDNSSSDEPDSPIEPSAAPDAEITYSFDAEKGPTQGSTVLSSALAKAVERFENSATEKLVRDEYDVLPLDVDELPTPMKIKGNGKGRLLTEEDDDYEFV